jgi:hypothetical protein
MQELVPVLGGLASARGVLRSGIRPTVGAVFSVVIGVAGNRDYR